MIEKVCDGVLFPRCPSCGVPLYLESKELTNSQKETQRRYDECDHVMMSSGRRLHPVCKKCGFSYSARFVPMARLMRCPRCACLYHVEGD